MNIPQRHRPRQGAVRPAVR